MTQHRIILFSFCHSWKQLTTPESPLWSIRTCNWLSWVSVPQLRPAKRCRTGNTRCIRVDHCIPQKWGGRSFEDDCVRPFHTSSWMSSLTHYDVSSIRMPYKRVSITLWIQIFNSVCNNYIWKLLFITDYGLGAVYGYIYVCVNSLYWRTKEGK
jgi:hypothetical protein